MLNNPIKKIPPDNLNQLTTNVIIMTSWNALGSKQCLRRMEKAKTSCTNTFAVGNEF